MRGWVVSQFEGGTGPHPLPATQRQYIRMGGREGVWAGAAFKLRHYPWLTRITTRVYIWTFS
jgi:hypothetical protein